MSWTSVPLRAHALTGFSLRVLCCSNNNNPNSPSSAIIFPSRSVFIPSESTAGEEKEKLRSMSQFLLLACAFNTKWFMLKLLRSGCELGKIAVCETISTCATVNSSRFFSAQTSPAINESVTWAMGSGGGTRKKHKKSLFNRVDEVNDEKGERMKKKRRKNKPRR